MTWLSSFIDWMLETLFQLNPGGVVFPVVSFFLYDVIKILLLLSVLIYGASYLQSYFSPERTKTILQKVNGFYANVIGALLGTLTPFCSCSSIPIFIGFTKAGLPIGVTFSFLISSPMVDLASVILLASIFGWGVALLYVLVGLLIAILGGSLISFFNMERYVEAFVLAKGKQGKTIEDSPLTQKERHHYAFEQVKEIFLRVYPYVFLGVGIGAVIHGVLPQAWIETALGADKWYAVPLATLLGIPMYADIFGTLPIAEALVSKGVGLGTVLSFMMAVTALSLPSLIMLKKVVKKELLTFFTVYLAIAIMFVGFLFNALPIGM